MHTYSYTWTTAVLSGNCSNELLSDVNKFKKRAAKILLDKSFDTTSSELFKELN
jgi:hypothetical protein